MANIFNLYPFLLSNDSTISIDIDTSTYLPGQICINCTKSIIYHQSISICKCHRFCHQPCILHHLQQTNKIKTFTTFICSHCNQPLKVCYQSQICRSFHINLNNTLNLILTLILFLSFLFLLREMEVALGRVDAVTICVCVVLGMFLGMLASCLINFFVVRKYRVVGVKQTNMDLVVSAFIGLEEQETSQDFLRDFRS